MPDALTDLSKAIAGSFRTMRQQEAAGKRKFGDWIARLVRALEPHLMRLYAGALAKWGGSSTADEAAAFVRERAIYAARSICDTTTEWLDRGTDPRSVFSPDRAAQIAVTEAAFMLNSGKAQVLASRGKRLKWRLGGKACPECRRLAGKTVKPGKAFGVTKGGDPVFAPPLHPNCKCDVVEAR